MGFMDKIKGIVNPGSNEGFGEDDMFNDETYYDDYQPQQQPFPQQPQQPYQPQQGPSGMALNSNSLELKIVKPDSFDNVAQIADHLLNRRTVVLNLEDTDRETTRRFLDFLSGVAYSIKGTMKRVADRTFVITPNNVGVSSVSMQAEPEPEVQPQPMRPSMEDDLFGGL